MSPTCLQSITAAVRRLPPPLDRRGIWKMCQPPMQSAPLQPSGKHSSPSATSSAGNVGVLGWQPRQGCLLCFHLVVLLLRFKKSGHLSIFCTEVKKIPSLYSLLATHFLVAQLLQDPLPSISWLCWFPSAYLLLRKKSVSTVFPLCPPRTCQGTVIACFPIL